VGEPSSDGVSVSNPRLTCSERVTHGHLLESSEPRTRKVQVKQENCQTHQVGFAAVPFSAIFAGHPNWAEALTGVGSILLTGGVAVAARQVREDRRVRVSTLVNEFSRRWDEPRLMDVRRYISQLQFANADDLRVEVLDCESNNPTMFWFYLRELNYFEELGLLHRRKVVNSKTLELMIGAVIRGRWEMWSPTVLAIQKRDDDDTYYENFARLGRLLQRRYDRGERRRRARHAVWRWLTTPQTPR